MAVNLHNTRSLAALQPPIQPPVQNYHQPPDRPPPATSFISILQSSRISLSYSR
ncbi:unnamed protein product [Dovyalis caffra]|uniref:Uncharacterized protein n=1 Tax=Dovyalis caffra TaxID=77055 RepID=A0AAV1RYN6_9ROSI|nr:unnamed protein product [Dovyalis caffra]